MKKYFLVFSVLVLISAVLPGCRHNRTNVPAPTEMLFKEMFPVVRHTQWTTEGNYYVASFEDSTRMRRAWFDNQGTWFLTETRMALEALPTSVQERYKTGPYVSQRFVDAFRLDRAGLEPVYVIQVWNGQTESDLFYTPDGLFIRAMEDYGARQGDFTTQIPASLPQPVQLYLQTNYPQARIVDRNRNDDGTYSVVVEDGENIKFLSFENDGLLFNTRWSVSPEEVPDSIRKAFSDAFQVKDYTITGIDYVKPAIGNAFFLYQLKIGDKTMDLQISRTGVSAIVPTQEISSDSSNTVSVVE